MCIFMLEENNQLGCCVIRCFLDLSSVTILFLTDLILDQHDDSRMFPFKSKKKSIKSNRNNETEQSSFCLTAWAAKWEEDITSHDMLSIVTACDPAGGQRQLIRNRPVINKPELTQRGTVELIPLPNTVQEGTPVPLYKQWYVQYGLAVCFWEESCIRKSTLFVFFLWWCTKNVLCRF